MNVPKIRFNGFNEEWQETKLCDIAKITMGQSPNSENYTNDSNDTLLIQGNADLNNGKVIPRLFTKQITKTCDRNDIIMTVRAPVGDIAISEYNACIGRGVCSIKSSKFVYHYLDYLKIKDYWKKISKGSTIDSITSDDIKSLLIKTPNKKEEEKIIKTVDLINKKIELQSKKIEDLKLFKKGLINNELNCLNNCQSVSLNDLGITYSGLSGKTKEDFENGNCKFINFMSVLKDNIDISSLTTVKINPNEKQNKVEKGDLFFMTSSETKEEVALCSTLSYDVKNLYLNSFCFGYRINDLNVINNEYLNCLLHSPKYRKQISNLGQGFTRVNISKNKLLELLIEVPDMKQQLRIVSINNKLNCKINLENEKLNKLSELKKGLMQKMFV